MLAYHHVVQLQITMRQAHRVQIADTVDDLQERTGNFLARHLPSHDDGEQIEWGVFHDLEPSVVLLDDIHGLDDVAMVEGRTNTELGRHFFRIILLRFPRMSLSELFDCKRDTIAAPLQQAHGTAGAGAQNFSELAVLGFQAVIVGERNV